MKMQFETLFFQEDGYTNIDPINKCVKYAVIIRASYARIGTIACYGSLGEYGFIPNKNSILLYRDTKDIAEFMKQL